jgi:hypothetical protein
MGNLLKLLFCIRIITLPVTWFKIVTLMFWKVRSYKCRCWDVFKFASYLLCLSDKNVWNIILYCIKPITSRALHCTVSPARSYRKQSIVHTEIIVIYYSIVLMLKGRDSSVGIATSYGLDGPGIESRWGRDFSQPSRLALGPTQPPIQWVPGLFPGG